MTNILKKLLIALFLLTISLDSALGAEIVVNGQEGSSSVNIMVENQATTKLQDYVAYAKSLVFDIWHYELFTMEKEPVTVANIVMALILLVLGLKFARRLARGTKTRLMRFDLDQTTLSALEKLVLYFYVAIIFVIVLDLSKFPMTVFTYIGGALALGIGLGSQNLVNNFMSGLVLLFERPIRVGDLIEVDPLTVGRVVSIGARCVLIKTNNNIDVLVPNSKMLENTVINWTLSDNIHTVKASFKIALSADTKKVESIFKDVLEKTPRILKTPPIQIFFMNFGEDGYQFDIYYSVDITYQDRREVITEVNHKIVEQFRKNNIAILPPLRMIRSVAHKDEHPEGAA